MTSVLEIGHPYYRYNYCFYAIWTQNKLCEQVLRSMDQEQTMWTSSTQYPDQTLVTTYNETKKNIGHKLLFLCSYQGCSIENPDRGGGSHHEFVGRMREVHGYPTAWWHHSLYMIFFKFCKMIIVTMIYFICNGLETVVW